VSWKSREEVSFKSREEVSFKSREEASFAHHPRKREAARGFTARGLFFLK
jgi:hypothetical protein